MLCGSVDARRAGEYMAEVRTSSQSERPCAGIEETRKPPGDAGGSSSPVNGDDHTGKRLAGKPHEPFERADGGRAKARPPPTLPEIGGKRAVHFSAEETAGARRPKREEVAELNRREGITCRPVLRLMKEFLEAEKKRLAGDTARAATSDEVNALRREASALKEVVADLHVGEPPAQKNYGGKASCLAWLSRSAVEVITAKAALEPKDCSRALLVRGRSAT